MSGCEWVVEAHGCDRASLANLAKLRAFFDRVIEELALQPAAPATWHQFPKTGGVTGLCLLLESHLVCHTFPEYGCLCLNLFCCRPRPEWDFSGGLKTEFAAAEVCIRRIERPYGEG